MPGENYRLGGESEMMSQEEEGMVTAEWMNLSEVSRMLGVHPSTARNWSNQGQLPVHRTQGGHRRFRRSEIEFWLQSRRADIPDEGHLMVQIALRRTRMQINEGRLEAEQWYQKLDEESRHHYRLSGRSLLQGLLGYLSSDGKVAEAEARAIGFEYASRGWAYGLTSVEATHAFLFFRNVLFESMLGVYESSAISSPKAWIDLFRKTNAFADRIQITLMETYEAYQRGSR
ncbi:MAG: helix-turn-helix domain-containing protein [Anaerolineales bacterium]|nr:helix-turn-helix domain-containing protein [Anaerolineales bacterium]